MIAFYKKYARTAFDLTLIVMTALLIMYILSYLLHIASPVFIGYLIFLINEPFASFLHKKGLKKIYAAAFSMILFIVAVLTIFLLLGVILTVQIQNLIAVVPRYLESIEALFFGAIYWVQTQLTALPPEVVEDMRQYSSLFFAEAAALVSGFLEGLFYALTSIPALLFNFIIGIILAFFLSIEVEIWRRLFKEKSPKTFRNAYYFLKEHVFSGIGQYLKAQLKLIGSTFVIVLAGLLILGIYNAFSVALLAALFDLLPLLGVATIFIPWIIYLLIIGEFYLGVWLMVLMITVILVRQFMEPKIMADSLGVSAFTVMAFMIVSLSIFGVSGVILSPLLIILIKALYKQGYLQAWIRLPEDEFKL
jgi:sporulation integral membrane protein YtvI